MDSSPTKDVDEPGLITMVSPDLCAVSVRVNGTSETLSFGKKTLYTWGNQCEESMTNLLEEGMEVNVLYKFPESQDKPSVVAVWVGDKPDLSISDDPLMAVYSQKGRVDQLFDDGSFIIRCDSFHHTAFARKEVMYRDGCLVGVDESPVRIDETVMFDATPFKFAHACGAMYRATCVWTGKEPGVTNRFQLSILDSAKQKLEVFTRSRVYGTVVVIPNDVIALVEVEDAEEKILLFRGSFSQSCEHMQDVVKVGDRLCVRLCFGYIFGHCRQWFAVEAWKDGQEVLEVNIDMLTRMEVERFEASLHDALKESKYLDGKLNGGLQSVEPKASSATLFGYPALQGRLSATEVDIECRTTGVIMYAGYSILVGWRNFYIGTKQCSKNRFGKLVKSRSIVSFEAVVSPLDVCNYNCTHLATLAWTRKKPLLFHVAPSLGELRRYFPIHEGLTIVGQVEGFYLPDVAFLKTTSAFSNVPVVCLHLSEFVNDPKYSVKCAQSGFACISDFVQLNDFLEFKIRSNDQCSLGLCAYDVKTSTQITFFESFVEGWFHVENSDSHDASLKTSMAVQFTPVYPLAKRSMVLNGLGFIRVDAEANIKLEHSFGSSTLDTSIVLPSNALLNHETLLKSNGMDFRFDAEFVAAPIDDQLCVKKIWFADPEQILASHLVSENSVDFNPKTLYCGVVTSTDLHKAAISVVGNIPVLVTLDSIVTPEEPGPKFSSVEVFLSVGDCVLMEIVGKRMEAGTYFKATSSYKLEGEPVTPGGELQVKPRNELSWQSVWGSGEYFHRGCVTERGDNYFVDFSPTKFPNISVSLDLSRAFYSGKLFVDGEPLIISGKNKTEEKERILELKGRKISFHVACHGQVPENKEQYSEAMYIALAWIGDYPDLLSLLKLRTAAPRGLVCKQWHYEGVVKDFPLPTHGICQVGALLVLLPLEPNNNSDYKSSPAKSRLKIGDKVILKIEHSFCKTATLLVASLSKSITKIYDDREVLRMVRGTIITMPKPTGKIKMDGHPLEVWFDRSVVVAINGIQKPSPTSCNFSWMRKFDKSVAVGVEVKFSAAKDFTLNNSYRAYEVWVLGLQE